MRFIYLDPGLWSNLGHHANTCRAITRELRTLGIVGDIGSFVGIEPELRTELGAIPLFRSKMYAKYAQYDRDPLCGWLRSFNFVSQITMEDLQRVIPSGRGDLVYMMVEPPQFMALIKWTAALPADRLPQVVVEFAKDPGLQVEYVDDRPRFSAPSPSRDPRAFLFRYAASHLPKSEAPRIRCVTYDNAASEAFQWLLEHPVTTLPKLQAATTSRRRRAGKRPIVVSVLGHQRKDKGYQLVPEIAKALLRARSDIRVLAHNGDPKYLPQPQQALVALATHENRLTVDERTAGPPIWDQLLEQSDLILCPYDPIRFASSYSAVASEALANAIPLVVPARTSLSRLLDEFGNPGTSFDSFTAASIIEASLRALDDFDHYAELAHAASTQWPQTHGPQNLVRALLAIANVP